MTHKVLKFYRTNCYTFLRGPRRATAQIWALSPGQLASLLDPLFASILTDEPAACRAACARLSVTAARAAQDIAGPL